MENAYHSSTVEALYEKYGKKPEATCQPAETADELVLGRKDTSDSFIPRGAVPKLLSVAIMAFGVLFSIGVTIGVAITHGGGGPVLAADGGHATGGGGITVTVLVFSIIAAFALGGLLTSIFLGGGFKFLRGKK